MSWTGCEQQRVASPRGVACIIVRIARAKVKKVVEKIKEERAEGEREFSFFCFSFKTGLFLFCAPAGQAQKNCLDARKNSLNSTQFSLQFSQNSITLLLFLC